MKVTAETVREDLITGSPEMKMVHPAVIMKEIHIPGKTEAMAHQAATAEAPHLADMRVHLPVTKAITIRLTGMVRIPHRAATVGTPHPTTMITAHQAILLKI